MLVYQRVFRILQRDVHQASIRSVSLLKPVSIATAKSSCRRMQRTMSYLARLLGTSKDAGHDLHPWSNSTAKFGGPQLSTQAVKDGQGACFISKIFERTHQ